MYRGLVPTSGDQQKVAVLISFKWPPSSRKIDYSISPEDAHPMGAPVGWTWARMNSILTQRNDSVPSDVVTRFEVSTCNASQATTKDGFSNLCYI